PSFTVLGAGVSGLSAAWYLARSSPNAPSIVVLDAAARVGGWVRSLPVPDHAALFETGPRTLRPAGVQGTATLEMVVRLGLQDKVIAVPKSSAAAKSRFIKYNGKLDKMPSSLVEALFPPKHHLFRQVFPRAAFEPFIPRSNLDDESIHDFVKRRFGDHVAEHMISALVHGIYAGDSRLLSVKSCFPFLWEAEKKHGSVIRGMLTARSPPEKYSADLSAADVEFIRHVKASSIYSFENGLESLPSAIAENLKAHYPNVKIITNAEVSRIERDANQGNLVIHTKDGKSYQSSKVVSALPSHVLAKVLPQSSKISGILSETPSVSVAVVNLLYDKPSILPVSGFGYLVPRSQASNVIGVIFDSEAVPDQSSKRITRITCMLGGAQFSKVFGFSADEVSSFDKDQCLKMALAAVEEDLGVSQLPADQKVTLHERCIPQYTLGHSDRLKAVHNLLQEEFSGSLSVIGCSYLGVGVNDCIYSAQDVVNRISHGESPTGLERVMDQ
ncbi:oxygen-dependent protoporphyrinogen oxidase, partial [Entophlyctis sp. JEL0112]